MAALHCSQLPVKPKALDQERANLHLQLGYDPISHLPMDVALNSARQTAPVKLPLLLPNLDEN